LRGGWQGSRLAETARCLKNQGDNGVGAMFLRVFVLVHNRWL